MCISERPKKLFGVAPDPVDDPWTLQLKQAWMARRSRPAGEPHLHRRPDLNINNLANQAVP